MNKRHAVVMLITLVLVVEACSESATEQPAASDTTQNQQDDAVGADDTLYLIVWQAPTILNPYLSPGDKELVASRITYEPLASYDKDGNLVPILAAEIPSLENGGVARDGMSVTWKLRSDVQWSDGTQFTAYDVRFTYEFISDPEIATTAYDTVKDVEAIDNETVTVHFKQPTPTWAYPFVGIEGLILPRHIFEQEPDKTQAAANWMPVGTGPYYVVDFETEEMMVLGSGNAVETKRIVYEPNPFFREPDKPFFKQVELRGGGDASTAAEMLLEQDALSYAWNLQVDTDLLEEVQAAEHVQLIADQGNPQVEHLVLNFRDPLEATERADGAFDSPSHPIFNDKRVRQALAYAIDRETIAEVYGLTGFSTSNILVAPPPYRSSRTPYGFDPQRAAALLDEAGWRDRDGDGIREKDGENLSIVYQTTINPVRQQMQEIIGQNLQDVGFEVQLKVADASIFFGGDPYHPDSAVRFQADIQQYSNGNQNPDPGIYMLGWSCSSVSPDVSAQAGQNSGRWCNDEYDNLYQQSINELDPQQRQQLFIQMNDILIEEVAVIPLVDHAFVAAASSRLAGIDRTPWDMDTWNIKDWRPVE